MRYQNLEDYIANLSESEKEQYKHLIEECRQRNIETQRMYDESRKKLEDLDEEIAANIEALKALKKTVNEYMAGILKLHSKVLLCVKPVFPSEQGDGHLLRHYPKSLN